MGNVPAKLLQTPPNEIGIPGIVLFELEVGIAKSTSPQKRKQQLTTFLSIVDVLPCGTFEAKQAAQIRVELEKQGNPIGPYDILIAATAIANRATLVTHNTKEFSRIENLLIVDWF